MTVAISCNLSDGVILGVDSAISVEGAFTNPRGEQHKGILKVYKSSEKLYKLSKFVGITTFGLGMIGSRSMGSYLSEFKLKHNKKENRSEKLEDICKDLFKFFNDIYSKLIKPSLEKRFNKKFNLIPDNAKPSLGFIVAGYSGDSPLSEIWNVSVPLTKQKKSRVLLRGQGNFGSNWHGVIEPVRRLIKGIDNNVFKDLVDYFIKKYNIKFNDENKKEIDILLARHERRILYDAMPIQEGIYHVKYLLDVVIHDTRFVVGAPICDSPVNIAAITRDSGFSFIGKADYTTNL